MNISERVAQERLAQGLPPKIEDEATLTRIAHLLRLAEQRPVTPSAPPPSVDEVQPSAEWEKRVTRRLGVARDD